MSFGFFDDQERAVLPYPEIRLPVLLIVESAVYAAWELLRTRPRVGFNLLTADEDAITLELHEALYDRVFKSGLVEGFDAEIFSSVEREPKVRSYDYAHPDKMPDLLVRLVGRSVDRNSQDGVFIECKPVDQQHGIRTHYCERGLARFVLGEYAWAMTTALMIGYTKQGYGISDFPTVLKKWQAGNCIGDPRICNRSTARPASEVVRSTEHVRNFKYLETDEVAPAITIRHLWLKRD